MTDLDLTKPLRIKHSQERLFLCPDLTNGRWLHGLCLRFETGPVGIPKVKKYLPATVHIGELENIPEPLVRYVRVQLINDHQLETIPWFGMPHTTPPKDDAAFEKGTLLKLTRTEDGKTHVEVIDD